MLTTAVWAAGLVIASMGAAYAGYVQKNLISNDTNMFSAIHEDTTLINPWGAAFFAGGPIWFNDNGSGLSALYNGDGTGFMGANPAPAVTVPPPKNSTSVSEPTGIVVNSSFGFILK